MPNLSKFRKATITIEGHPVELQVGRLRLEEAEAYRVKFNELFNNDLDQALSDDKAAWIRGSIETYLSLAPGALTVGDESITTGAQLLDVIGYHPGVVFRALLAIGATTSPTEDEGKRSASESVSVPSSDGHDQAPDGPRPATTAASAEPAGTAPIGDAMAATDQPSSGPTATLN